MAKAVSLTTGDGSRGMGAMTIAAPEIPLTKSEKNSLIVGQVEPILYDHLFNTVQLYKFCLFKVQGAESKPIDPYAKSASVNFS